MEANTPLRIVTFNNLPIAFQIVHGWARQAGHKIILTVTSPGPQSRRTKGYQEIASMAGEQNIELLITTRLKTIVTPTLQALKPDLILSFSFPWLLPPPLLATARLGAVNVHPTLLPAYRGPNPLRQIYDAAPTIGATLHWIDQSFDTGRIIAQHQTALPNPCTRDAVGASWSKTMFAALAEGIPKAVAGDPGTEQPSEGASYAAEFTEQDHQLDAQDSAYALQCKTTALAFFGAYPVQIRLEHQLWQITQVDLIEQPASSAAAGTILERLTDGAIIQTGQGIAKLHGQPV